MSNLKLLGDPHLGKQFKHGVPVHRKGDRERAQAETFSASLNDVSDGDVHCCVGDIFDKFSVPNEFVDWAANQYERAARANPKVMYILIPGNHDLSRDSSKVSSFTLLARILNNLDLPNLKILTDKAEDYGGYLFVPWHPFKEAEEMIPAEGSFEAVVGHWDIEAFGDHNPNLIPLKALKAITSQVYTGHIHLASEYEEDGLTVTVVGSMLPFAHGEDQDGSTYVTVTLEELEEMTDTSDKCIRVLLKPGETLPSGIDCLQLKAKRLSDTNKASDTDEVKIDDFDFKEVFDQVMKENNVPDQLRDEAWEKYLNASD